MKTAGAAGRKNKKVKIFSACIVFIRRFEEKPIKAAQKISCHHYLQSLLAYGTPLTGIYYQWNEASMENNNKALFSSKDCTEQLFVIIFVGASSSKDNSVKLLILIHSHFVLGLSSFSTQHLFEILPDICLNKV